MHKKCKLFLFLSLFFLASCGKDKLNDGDCSLKVGLLNIPKEYSMQEENIMEHTAVNITLKNEASQKEYHFQLTPDNQYFAQLSLLPGNYTVVDVQGETKAFDEITYSASAVQLSLSQQTPAQLLIALSDEAAFNKHWKDIQPSPEILLENPSSGKLQINRQIINAEDLMTQITIDGTVEAGETKTFEDAEMGIFVTVKNNDSATKAVKNCTLLQARFTKNKVVLPSGITLGMAPKKVFHKTEGYFKEPTSLGGTIFLGRDMAETKVTYHIDRTNDDITFLIDPTATYITGIIYEFGQIE